jgi:adenosylcobinamide-GDP ribazoletransferase
VSTGLSDSAASAPRSIARGFVAAVTFLTIVPLPGRAGVRAAPSALWFPLVGAGVGALSGGAMYGVTSVYGPGVGAVIAVAVLVITTGGLHLDGLADCADALGVHGDGERRRAAMRDSRVGVFGAAAIGLWLLVMSQALETLQREHALVLVGAIALARCGALLHACLVAPARTDGLGASFAATVPVCVCAAAMALAIVVAVAGPVAAAASFVVVAAVTVAFGVLAARTFGGRSGDTLGAVIALAEAAACTTLLACVR